MCVKVTNLGSQRCWSLGIFEQSRDHGRFEERCAAFLFGTTMVMTRYAPDSSKSSDMYEICMSSVVKVLREGRQGGAKGFHITGHLNVEMGMMCTDENDVEELTGMHDLLCW